MNKDKIEDSEILYRVIRKSYPSTFSRTGKLLGAVFIDPKGASVERDGGRKEQDIIAALKVRFKKNDYDCSAKITALNCRNANTYPNPVGNQKNEYHAEIWDSETQQKETNKGYSPFQSFLRKKHPLFVCVVVSCSDIFTSLKKLSKYF